MNSDERESLRRIAYGPDATPHERFAAERSLRQLDESDLAAAADARDRDAFEAQQQREADATVGVAAKHIDSGDSEAADVGHTAAAPSLWQRSIRVGWLIPLVAGCLVVGVAGALSATGGLNAKEAVPNVGETVSASQGTTTEFAITPPMPGYGPGNVDAANDWFTVPATEGDELPAEIAEGLGSMGVSVREVRSVGNESALQQKLWIVRQATGGFCMVSAGSDRGPGWISSCATIEQFQASSLSLSGPGIAAYWNGESMSTSN